MVSLRCFGFGWASDFVDFAAQLVGIWCFAALGVDLVTGFGSGRFAAGYGVLCL